MRALFYICLKNAILKAVIFYPSFSFKFIFPSARSLHL